MEQKKEEMIKCFEIGFRPDECKVALNSDSIGTLKVALLPAFKEFMNYFNEEYYFSYKGMKVPKKIAEAITFPNSDDMVYIISFDFREVWKKEDINTSTVYEFKARRIQDYEQLKDFVTTVAEYIRTRTDISKLTRNASVYIKVNNGGI